VPYEDRLHETKAIDVDFDVLGYAGEIEDIDRRSRAIAGKIEGNGMKPSASKTLLLERPDPGAPADPVQKNDGRTGIIHCWPTIPIECRLVTDQILIA